MNETLTIGESSTDEQITAYMIESTSVQDWNDRREIVKTFRDSKWVIAKLDGSGLIMKAKIPTHVEVLRDRSMGEPRGSQLRNDRGR